MASPQKEHGYIPIANEIVEHLARIRIPGEAMQVLWVIFRKTYGFNKKHDEISLSQLSLATGMHRKHVWRAVSKLVELGVVSKKGDTQTNGYVFIKDYEKWRPSPKKGISPKKRRGVPNNGEKVSPKKGNTKDKRHSTKDIASQSDAAFIVQVIDAFKEINPTFKRWYANTSQRASIDRMLVEHGLDLVLKVVALLPQTNSKPYFPTITTPIQLETDWAKLRYRLEQEKNKTISKGRGIA